MSNLTAMSLRDRAISAYEEQQRANSAAIEESLRKQIEHAAKALIERAGDMFGVELQRCEVRVLTHMDDFTALTNIDGIPLRLDLLCEDYVLRAYGDCPVCGQEVASAFLRTIADLGAWLAAGGADNHCKDPFAETD